ncbi:MAG: deoxyuridine 5'-triphosphate nucleotidohydrolase [Dehalococcoidia bacterium]|nr:deoxyuridine 5'-triphosphate nucleotidohydrolase [Dehalococcoidia bacterium]
MPFILSGDEIRAWLKATPPLVEGLLDGEQQIQPNGIDLTVKEIASFTSPGTLSYDNKARSLSHSSPLACDELGAIHLTAGCYLVTYNEVVHLPRTMVAFGFPRSSLLRCGATIHTAVWDAGYSGRSQSPLVVHNPTGLHLHINARITQLVFFHLGQEVGQGYQGMFQGENI